MKPWRHALASSLLSLWPCRLEINLFHHVGNAMQLIRVSHPLVVSTLNERAVRGPDVLVNVFSAMKSRRNLEWLPARLFRPPAVKPYFGWQTLRHTLRVKPRSIVMIVCSIIPKTTDDLIEARASISSSLKPVCTYHCSALESVKYVVWSKSPSSVKVDVFQCPTAQDRVPPSTSN